MHGFAPLCIPTSSAQESSVSPQPPGLLVTLCGSDGGRPNGSEVISKLILICISPPIGDIELLFSCPLPVRVASLRSICVALARFQSGHCRSPARSVGAPRASCTRPPGWSHRGSARPSRRRPRSLPGSAARRLPLLWLGLLVSLRQLTPVLLWEFQGFTSLFRADFYLWVEEKAPISLCAAVPFPKGTILSRRMRSAPCPGAGGRSEGVCFRAPRPARGSGFCVRPRTWHLPCCSSVTHPKPGSAAVSNWRLGRFFMMTKQVNFAFRSNFFIANSHFP